MYGEDANVAKTTDSVHKKRLSLEEQVKTAWPFTRVDPKILERAHRLASRKTPTPDIDAEPAPF